ncbi:MAG: type I-E CRISPR-associated protein Cas6/Cse3/CasE [Smithella sp.]|nr:type I-E CRISPR-associated protein Cas6/Cse3/CasE [Smithella sp.]
MYFSMITLQKGLSPHDVNVLASHTGYQSHQLVWQLFADHEDRKRDFIYRYEARNGTPTFYTVSERKPSGDAKIWQIHTKEYKPKLWSGQLLGFTVCANPIRAKREENGKQKRHDVIMEEKLKLKKEGKDCDMPDIVQKYGLQWLEERAVTHGFSVTSNNVRVDGYRQHKFFKRKGNSPISLSTIDINGILTVMDPDVFIDKCLFKGIGPAKGFGCGMMLVRRV